MEKVKNHPQVSTNRKKIKSEKLDIAKIIKMGSLHASQKWSLSENKPFLY